MKAAAEGLRAAGDALRVGDAAGVRKALAAALSPAAAREVEAVLKGTFRLESLALAATLETSDPALSVALYRAAAFMRGAVLAAWTKILAMEEAAGTGGAGGRDPEALAQARRRTLGGETVLLGPWPTSRATRRSGKAKAVMASCRSRGRTTCSAGSTSRPRGLRRGGFGGRRGRRGRNGRAVEGRSPSEAGGRRSSAAARR